MTKIRINCGGCAKAKGCEAKKKFRDLARTINVKYDIPFSLKCPLKEHKYKEGQGLKVTVGVGQYYKKVLWDCDWEVNCNGCKNEEICDDGTVTFNNLMYREYIELSGTLENNYGTNKCVIRIEKNQIKNKGLTTEDMRRLEMFSRIIHPNHTMFENQDNHMFIISKEKYVTRFEQLDNTAILNNSDNV